jgi:putative membrane protein
MIRRRRFAVFYDGGWNGGAWALMMVMMVLFWGAVLTVVVWAVRTSGSRQQGPSLAPPMAHPGRGARDVLDERFARGEIGEDEYRQRRSVLEQQ